jgi:two-component system OmpR family response regulator
MSDQPHIVVVDDHRDIRDLLGRYLRQHEYRVTLASDGRELRKLMNDDIAPDLIVRDLMMPGEDGLSLCRWLRENYNVPVVMLTALGEETDRIIGLEMGADDYLAKPFNPRELLARIKAVLRRAQSLPVGRKGPLPGGQVHFDRWVLDRTRHELRDTNDVVVPLSAGEYGLLCAFVEHPNMVLNRDQLLDLTKGREAIPFDRSIDNQVSRLRKKIERDAKNPALIKTVWGGGYMFTCEVAEK